MQRSDSTVGKGLRRVAALAIAACLTLTAGEAEGLALRRSGPPLSGLAAWIAEGMRVGATVVPWHDLAASGLAVRPAAFIDRGLFSRAGEILRGQPGTLADGRLEFTADLGGPAQVPVDALAAVVLAPTRLDVVAASLAAGPGAVLLNGDRLAGTLAYLDATTAGLDAGQRLVRVPRERIALLVLAAPAAQGDRLLFSLVTGERVLGPPTTEFRVATCAGDLTLAPALIASCWTEAAGCQPLAVSPPLRVTASDRFDAGLPVVLGRGLPAQAGVAAAQGIELPARGEIAWPITGATRLLAWVVVAPGAETGSAAVALDGTIAWTRELHAGEPPVAVEVPLAGAAEVALRSEAGAEGATERRALLWCHPVLVR
jgi:hypothetical protein